LSVSSRRTANSCRSLHEDLPPTKPNKRGRKPLPGIEFPEPLTADWLDPSGFPEAFSLQLARHGESCWHLHRMLLQPGERFDRKTFQDWARGAKLPATVRSFEMLARVERRYRLPTGYFRSKLAGVCRAASGRESLDVSPSVRRRLAWHLPDDFDSRPSAERADILQWVRTNIISGSTDYRRFQAQALRVRYGLRFPKLTRTGKVDQVAASSAAVEPRAAPPELVGEVADLVAFKTATLTKIGVKRYGVWNEETVAQKIEHLALLFGALSSTSDAPPHGLGLPREALTLALLVLPSVWDWYVQWREARRGFFTVWEVDMLVLGASLTRRETGWLRQHPQIAARLTAVPASFRKKRLSASRRTGTRRATWHMTMSLPARRRSGGWRACIAIRSSRSSRS
jgi:hypothetical protein